MGKLREYLNSTSLELHYKDNMLNVVNYNEIVLLTDKKIVIIKDNKEIIIEGEKLTLLKLLDSEVLIQGIIKSIEL